MAAKIALTMFGSEVRANPASFLGGDLFQTYRNACAKGGAKAKKDEVGRWYNACSMQGVMYLAAALRDAGFVVDIDPGLVATISAAADAAETDVAAADERAAALDAILKKKGLALFGFQYTGVKWLAAQKAAMLCDDMGLGKTIQALVALPEAAPVLVLSPAVAKGVWQREIMKWRGEYSVTLLEGRGSFRWPAPGEIVCTNYDILPDPETLPPGAPAGLVVVADEAHVLKNTKAQRTQRARAILKLAREKLDGRTWGLTATPLLNRPMELWSILTTFGLAGITFGSWPRFIELMDGRQDRWGGWSWGKPSPEVGALLRRAMLRRMRSEVLKDLPPKVRALQTGAISKNLTKQLDKLQARIEETQGAWNTLFAMHGHAPPKRGEDGKIPFEEISAARAALAEAKIPAMLAMVESCEEQDSPLLVFSAHLAPLHALRDREGWALITGETSATERTAIEDRFQKGELRGVACSIKAGGVAITLTRATNEIFVDREWTPALNNQAEDRAHRIGQVNSLTIHELVADHPMDARVTDLLLEKQTLIDNTVERATVSGDAAVATMADHLNATIRAIP